MLCQINYYHTILAYLAPIESANLLISYKGRVIYFCIKCRLLHISETSTPTPELKVVLSRSQYKKLWTGMKV